MRQLILQLPSELTKERLLGYARCVQIETWLRELVYLEGKAHYGSSYWIECEAALKRQNAYGIPAKRSLERDQQHPHMATAETDPLWFVSFDTLTKIVLDEVLWPLFSPYLTTKKLVDAKFDELRVIRNRIGHARSLHQDDLDRFCRVLKDFDQGFWRFCTSYADRSQWRTGEEQQQDLVGAAFLDSGDQYGIETDVELTRRATSPEVDFSKGKRGWLYRFIFSTVHERRFLNYQEVLQATTTYHNLVAHICLDSHQRDLRVTIPAVEEPASVVDAARHFAYACANCYTSKPLFERLEERLGKDDDSSALERFDRLNSIFDGIASEWPHYVVSTSHPYTFLDSSTPCRFFEA